MLLDTLVKLASTGTFGICIFAIFWAGSQLTKIPVDAPRIRYDAFKTYMRMCSFISVIAGTVGSLSMFFNYKQIVQAKAQVQTLTAEATNVKHRLRQAEGQLASTTEQIDLIKRSHASQLAKTALAFKQENSVLKSRLNVVQCRIESSEATTKSNPKEK